MIQHITEHQFENYVIKSNKNLVLVDFWAPWCKPCQNMKEAIESVSRRFTLQMSVVKINIDDESNLTKMYGVRSIPTILFFQHGKVVKSEIGFKSENELTGIIAELLKKYL